LDGIQLSVHCAQSELHELEIALQNGDLETLGVQRGIGGESALDLIQQSLVELIVSQSERPDIRQEVTNQITRLPRRFWRRSAGVCTIRFMRIHHCPVRHGRYRVIHCHIHPSPRHAIASWSRVNRETGCATIESTKVPYSTMVAFDSAWSNTGRPGRYTRPNQSH
jgi:hypothetical protein